MYKMDPLSIQIIMANKVVVMMLNNKILKLQKVRCVALKIWT